MSRTCLFKALNAMCGLAFLFMVVLSLAAPDSATAAAKRYEGTPAKYVFVFIGDGMGLPQRAAAQQFTGKQLLMDSFPAQGITTTHAADRFITGSAASATAVSCGQKTNIGMIGMAPDQRPVKTVAEIARDKGMKVGIISSVSIDHATPAAFYAHVPSRNQYYDIDVALAESNFDFFGGGGLKDPTNKKKNAANFKGNALDLMKKNGYKIVTDRTDFMKLKPADGKIVAWNKWLQDSGAMPYAMDMTEKDVTLPEFTAKAIEMLDNPKGFFIMVEGGKIDWACHANDATASIKNTLAFDQSIQEAVNFSVKHPEETLIIVTGDHECGGLTLGFAGTKYASNFDVLGKQNVSFQKFTDEILGAYKKGCSGACRFSSMQPLITQHFGLKFEGDPKADPMVLESHQVKQIQAAFDRTVKGEKEGFKNKETYLLYGEYDPLTVTLTHILNQKAGLAWTSYKHTGVPVSTSATGVGAEIFNGFYDNTDIALKVMSVMGVDAKVHVSSSTPQMPNVASSD